MKSIERMLAKYVAVMFMISLLAISNRSFAQCSCTPTSAFPTTVNGITINLNSTGSVTNYGANWPSCGLSAGPMWVGSTGPFTQTFTFSSPVNNVYYVITAASVASGGPESFTFTVGSGVLSASQCGGTCPFTQVGNAFTCTGADDGTMVLLSSTSSYTSFTVSGGGGSNGSLAGICVQSFSSCVTPTLTISPSSSVCFGAAKTLTVSGSSSYTWSPAISLSSATGSVVTAAPGTTTTYSVLAGAGTCTATAFTTVSVTPSPTVLASPTSTTICRGSSATLTASGAISYTWNPSATLSSANATVVTASPTVTTTYTVTGANATCTNSAVVTVSVTPNPTLTLIPATATICAGASTTLSATGATSYTWSPSTALSNPNLATVVASPTVTTNYTVTGATGICTNTAVASVSVIAIPVLTVSPQTPTICAGTSTTLTATGATSYTWTPALGLSATGGSVVVASPASTTAYSITAGIGTCTSAIGATVTINPVPTLTLTPALSAICIGTSSTLTATGATSYTWDPPAGLSTTTGSVVVASPTTSTNYTITGLIGICSTTAIATVNIFTVPILTVSPQTATICAGSSVTLAVTGTTSYTWSPATGLNTTTGNVVIASPLVNTIYTVIGGVGTCTAALQATVTADPVPTLTVTPTAISICAGTSTTLTVAGTSTSYTWSPSGTLNTSSGNTVIATPLSTNSYSVTGALNSCTAVATATVNVIANPTLTIVANTNVCAGNSATLSIGGASTYSWSPSTYLNTSTGNVVVCTPVNTTAYSIIGTLNTCTAVANTTVTVIPRPVIVMGADANICSGTQASISASGATTYSWIPSAGLLTSMGGTINASPNSTTVYTVTGTTSGCSSTGSLTVFVTPTPTIIATAVPSSICKGTSSSLAASGATTYTWSPNTYLTVDNLPNTVASPILTTNYTIIGANGSCVSSNTVEVTVIPTATPVVNGVAAICLGQSTTIEATGGTVYHWLPLTGMVSANLASTVVRPTATTVYTVTVSGNGLCPATTTVEVVVNPVPHVYAGRDTTINIDEYTTLVGTGDVEVGFLAPTPTPLLCNFCNSIVVNPPETTCYVLRGENGYHCYDYDTVCVYVTKDYNIFIPNAFTPNEDGNNDEFIPVGYGLSEIRLTIFDRWGTQIFTSNDTHIGWDGSNKGKQCEQGVYIYQAEIKTMAGDIVKRTGHVTLLPKSVIKN